jgi:murein DD-endopeptidase MepM/ murein hydrolase activator NlpD/serine/threonine protein kinase
MKNSANSQFNLSKRVKILSKFIGYKSAFALTGSGKLGEGAFGSVFSSKGAAVKVAHPKGQKELQNEMQMLKEVQKVGVAPKLLGAGKGYVAIQKFDGNILKDASILKKIKEDPIFADYIFRKIIEAVGALHRSNVAQRDLHAGNIFITKDYQVKILDYGQAAKNYRIAYYETFFGNNHDPLEGVAGLIQHIFDKTRSYKTYHRILINQIKKISAKANADIDIILKGYEEVEGDENKERIYFDELAKISSPPANDTSDVSSFYNALDSALKINTKNPNRSRRVSSNLSMTTGVTKSLNNKSKVTSTIPKFETGGTVDKPGVVQLHGRELVLPKEAIKPVKKNGRDNTEIAVGILIAYGVFPHTQEGIKKAEEAVASNPNWVVPSMLPNYYDDIETDLMRGKETNGIIFIRNILISFYKVNRVVTAETNEPIEGETQIYKPADKFVDDGKEFIDGILDNAEKALEEKSNEIMDAIDAVIAADTKKYEDFKKQLERKVDHPELYEELQHIQPRYMWGQNGLYDLEFKSDIDRAIYFAGKLGNKDTPDKVAVRGWLLEVTGLDVRADYQKIKEYRDRILALILQLVKLHPNERDVIVPPVYDGYYQDPPDEDEGEEVDDQEYDDLYGSNLDDLLDDIRTPKSEEETDQELNEQLDDATQVLDEAEQAQQEAIDESVLEDLPEDLQQTLVDFINKRRNQKPDKEKTSTSISNRKIYNFLTTNLLKIQDQLQGISEGIQNQNTLMAANVSATFAIIDKLESQDNIIAAKLDGLTEAFNRQTELAKLQQDKQEDILAEQRAESQRDAAGTEGFTDYSGKGGGLFANLLRFFGKKLARFIWRLLPRRLRAAARLGRMAAKRLGSKILQRSAAKASTKIATKVPTTAIAKGFEHIALPGVTRAVAPATEKIAKGGGMNVFQRALKSKAIQQALIKKLGKDGAEKLTVKLAAKLVPGVATAYGLGEGIARIAMGDVKGGFLSFGSAIPVAGWGFAAIDILRDIDTNAYTKHIEPNLPSPSGENFGAFFNDALGVSSNQYETGGVTKKGIATLHGTEAVVPKDNFQAVDPIGGVILAATSQYINKVGPAAAQVAPAFEQVAAPLAKVYDVPNTLVQTNVGGSFPSMENSFKRISSFGKGKKEEELTGAEKDLMDTKDEDSFVEKLKKFIDPDNIFEKIVSTIGSRPQDSPTINGDGLMAEGGEAVAAGDISDTFGSRGGRHLGIDIASSRFREGTPISVIKPGKVVFAGWEDPNNHKAGWGQFVAIEHDDGTTSLYGHLSSINVGVGQRIEPSPDGKFPVIGKIGSTGRSTGPHLHFEVGTGWTGGTLKGHMNPAPIVGQYFRGGGNVVAKTNTDAPPGPAPPMKAPSGSYDVIIPLDHVKPGNQTKIPDKKGGNTFKNASATGADGREREHQDKAAAKIKAKLEKKGLRVKIITPEDFGNYEDYDKYIMSQSAKGTRIVPVHFDAAVGQGGTGFLTRTRAGDSADAALAKPIQSALSTFQRSNPSLGNLGPTDTQSNATINRASAAPAALVELGSMVAWEKQYGKNFTSTQKFDQLATSVANAIYTGGQFKAEPPKQQVRTLNMPGTDTSKQHLVVVAPSKPNIPGVSAEFVSMGNNQWKTVREYDNSALQIIMTKLRQ